MRNESLLVKSMICAFDKKLRAEGVVCYGASKKGEMAKRYFDENNINIKLFCDSDPLKSGSEFLGYSVISPEQLLNMGKDIIIYISSVFAEEIYSSLKADGFKFIIKPQDINIFFNYRYDCYITGTNSLSMRFYETFCHQLNIKGFIKKSQDFAREPELFCGKPIINANNFDNESKDVFIFNCDFAGTPYNLSDYKNVYDGAKILFLMENYGEYKNFFNAFYESENNYSMIAHMLSAISNALNSPKPKYADIGACDPVINNNTYIFYERGATGQLFEPLPIMYEKLKKERPRDNVINAGIGVSTIKNEVFYMNKKSYGLSTFLYTNKFAWENRINAEYEEIYANMIEFNDIIDPETEIVSMDCEGMDFDIIKTIDFDKFRNIKIICAETPYYETIDYMKKNGFTDFWVDNYDAIFIKSELFQTLMSDRLCREIYYGAKHLNSYYNIPASFLRKY